METKRCIYVDDDNPNYCDIDGVLYNKDMTEIICYPIDHDRYLRLQNGYAHLDENGVRVSDLVDDNGNPMEELWGTTEKYDEEFFKEYNFSFFNFVLLSTSFDYCIHYRKAPLLSFKYSLSLNLGSIFSALLPNLSGLQMNILPYFLSLVNYLFTFF